MKFTIKLSIAILAAAGALSLDAGIAKADTCADFVKDSLDSERVQERKLRLRNMCEDRGGFPKLEVIVDPNAKDLEIVGAAVTVIGATVAGAFEDGKSLVELSDRLLIDPNPGRFLALSLLLEHIPRERANKALKILPEPARSAFTKRWKRSFEILAAAQKRLEKIRSKYPEYAKAVDEGLKASRTYVALTKDPAHARAVQLRYRIEDGENPQKLCNTKLIKEVAGHVGKLKSAKAYRAYRKQNEPALAQLVGALEECGRSGQFKYKPGKRFASSSAGVFRGISELLGRLANSPVSIGLAQRHEHLGDAATPRSYNPAVIGGAIKFRRGGWIGGGNSMHPGTAPGKIAKLSNLTLHGHRFVQVDFVSKGSTVADYECKQTDRIGHIGRDGNVSYQKDCKYKGKKEMRHTPAAVLVPADIAAPMKLKAGQYARFQTGDNIKQADSEGKIQTYRIAYPDLVLKVSGKKRKQIAGIGEPW